MSDEFDGRVVVVTGAAGNLGSAVADAFFAAGARVAGVVHDGGAAAAADPRRAIVVADLLDAAATRAAAAAVLARWGRIDVLCNIAGGFAMGPAVHEAPDALWRRMFDLNVMTAVHAVQAVVPAMIAARSGCVVNVAAASSAHGGAGAAAYAVAKNGVARLSESMAAELKPWGVSVHCLMPTILDTPQNRAAMPRADRTAWISLAALSADVVALARSAL